jgi:hypothetical protein
LAIWGSLVALLAMAAFVFTGMNRLKNLSQQISAGMPREQVEELLGEPRVTLPVSDGSGELLVWVDSYWQVDVRIDNDGRVVLCRCVPSNSWFRNTQSRLSSLFR